MKINGEFGGILGGDPFAPYASSAGMISSRLPPTLIPTTPWSQPLMTWPSPSVKVKGSLVSRRR